MISLNSYLEYEKKVMTLLMDKLLAESNLEQNIRANYRYKHQGQVYEFDIVVLGEKERIKTIYAIKMLKKYVFSHLCTDTKRI